MMFKKSLLMLAALSALPAFAQQADEKKMTFSIPEMYCQLCVYLVNKEVRQVDGVVSSKASFKERKVSIIAKQEVSEQAIVQAVKNLNYTAILEK